jgi:hypothetical protein
VSSADKAVLSGGTEKQNYRSSSIASEASFMDESLYNRQQTTAASSSSDGVAELLGGGEGVDLTTMLHRGGTSSLDEDLTMSEVQGKGAEKTSQRRSSCRGRRAAPTAALAFDGLRSCLHSLANVVEVEAAQVSRGSRAGGPTVAV